MSTAMTRSIVRRASLTLAVAATLAGCRDEITGIMSAEAAHASRAQRQSTDDAPAYSDWSEPVNLGPVVNSANVDIEVSISRDGLSLYLASNRPGGHGGFDIWVARRAGPEAPWGPPENLGPTINTSFNEQGPSLTIDGHRLYFFSNRPGGFGGSDLYVTRRRDARDDFGWRPAANLGAGVNSSFNENLSAQFEDEAGAVTLYFNSNRPASSPGLGGTDIYASTLQADDTFGPAVLVEELSTPFPDAGPFLRRDGLELFIASTSGSAEAPRPGAFGRFDLWRSTRASTSHVWSAPVNMGPVINTAHDESRASLSFDGTTLYFISDRPGGSGNLDIWMTTRTKLTGGGAKD
ncbi:MAG TPA: hypothetical protein VMM18_12775 [Gemmatimonadaceae bacterium]|nr:hypothetical protein [Gemmatimonadaceae bacterium]